MKRERWKDGQAKVVKKPSLREELLPNPDRIRWSLWRHGGLCLKVLQHHLDSFLELRIASGNHVLGRLLDFDVGWHAFVLDDEAIFRPEGKIRSGDRTTIHQHGETKDANKSAPSAFADQRTELKLTEHPSINMTLGPWIPASGVF